MSEDFTFFGMAITKNVGNDWWEWVQAGDCYPWLMEAGSTVKISVELYDP